MTAFCICAIFGIPLLQSLITAATGTMAEFVPDKKPFWADNLRIPVFVGLVLWILM
jgi:dolichol kinase